MTKGRRTTSGVDVDRLDQTIKDLGVRVRIYRSTLCPNMTSLESLDHHLNCDVCSNNFIDFDCFESIAMFQQQELTEQFKIQGTFSLDEVFLTFLSGITLQTFTKIELLDFKEDFYELIQRQEGTSKDKLKYRACEVQGIFTVNNGNLERYYQGADFKIDKDGNIDWTGTHKPSDKQVYTIYYRYYPIYRLTKGVHRDRFSQYNLRPDKIKAPKTKVKDNTYIKLPETWIAQRDYFLDRKDTEGNEIPDNEYYDPNEP